MAERITTQYADGKPRWACECAVCGYPFPGKSCHALYCSSVCRAVGYLKARRERGRKRQSRAGRTACKQW